MRSRSCINIRDKLQQSETAKPGETNKQLSIHYNWTNEGWRHTTTIDIISTANEHRRCMMQTYERTEHLARAYPEISVYSR